MIREFDIKNIDKLMSLWLESTSLAHPFIEKDYWLENFEHVKNDCLLKAKTYVFIDRHQIKGFISILKDNYIGALFVAPQSQHHKIGTKLLNYVKRLKPNLSLSVYVNNENAVNFYQKNGFKIISDRTELETGEDELLMAWTLASKHIHKRQPGDS